MLVCAYIVSDMFVIVSNCGDGYVYSLLLVCVYQIASAMIRELTT